MNDTDLIDRYVIAKMDKAHAMQLTSQAEAWLRSALKGTVQAVVNGERLDVRR